MRLLPANQDSNEIELESTPSDALIKALYKPPFSKFDKSNVSWPSPSTVEDSSSTKFPAIVWAPINISKVISSIWLSLSETLISKVWDVSWTRVFFERPDSVVNEISGLSLTELTVMFTVAVLVTLFSTAVTEYWNSSVPKKSAFGLYKIPPFEESVKAVSYTHLTLPTT